MNIVHSQSKLLPCTESLSHESACFVLLCLTLFRKQYQGIITSFGYSVQMTSSFLSHCQFLSLTCILPDLMWGARGEDHIPMLNCILCFVPPTSYWAKYFWGQGNNQKQCSLCKQQSQGERWPQVLIETPESSIKKVLQDSLMPIKAMVWCIKMGHAVYLF